MKFIKTVIPDTLPLNLTCILNILLSHNGKRSRTNARIGLTLAKGHHYLTVKIQSQLKILQALAMKWRGN